MLLRTAKSCGPDASVVGVKTFGGMSARPGADVPYPEGHGGKIFLYCGESALQSVKPLRAGTSGDSGVLVVTRVLFTNTCAHEAAGATGIRRSPRPLWAEDSSTARAHGAAR